MKKLKLDELERIPANEYKNAVKMPVTIVLDNVRSLHNVGSAFRTADAFLAERIILTGITGTPPNREIQKTALGATDSVPWEYNADSVAAINTLRSEGYTIISVEQTDESVMLQDFTVDPKTRYALVFGNEVNGVSDDVIALTDMALEIPQGGSKHSLNVSVCLGVVVWHIFRQLMP